MNEGKQKAVYSGEWFNELSDTKGEVYGYLLGEAKKNRGAPMVPVSLRQINGGVNAERKKKKATQISDVKIYGALVYLVFAEQTVGEVRVSGKTAFFVLSADNGSE